MYRISIIQTTQNNYDPYISQVKFHSNQEVRPFVKMTVWHD